MIVFRLCKVKYANDLSGRGAELTGGRWNSRGIAMIYTSESRALCMAEIAVHVPLGIIPEDYQLISIDFPESLIASLDIKSLAGDWKSLPHSNSSQLIGDKFIQNGEHLVLKVPSAIVQDEYNYLINPRHADAKLVKIIKVEPFSFDPRLFK